MWKFFEKELPEDGKEITIIWTDGLEWFIVWNMSECKPYLEAVGEDIPLLWKYR